jgi:hypothetical protein
MILSIIQRTSVGRGSLRFATPEISTDGRGRGGGGGGDSNTARTLPSLPLGYNLQAAHKYAKQHVGPTDTQETPPSLRLWAEKLDLKVEFRYPE